MFKTQNVQRFTKLLMILFTIYLHSACANIKDKLMDIDAKFDSIKTHFSLQETTIRQLGNKIDHLDNQIKILSNALTHQSKISEMSLLNDRLRILENNVGHLTNKIDVLSAMDNKLDQLLARSTAILDTRCSKSPSRMQLNSMNASSKPSNKSDKFDKGLETIVQQQELINNRMDSYVKFADQINRTLEKLTLKSNQTIPTGHSPASLVLPQSTLMRNVMLELIETASHIIDEDDVDGLVTTARQTQPVNLDTGSPPENKNNLKKGHTANLLKQLWKKFTKPMVNLSKHLTDLEEIGLKGLDLCERSVNRASSLETIMNTNFAKIQSKTAPETPCCDIVLKRIDNIASKTDKQLTDLEQRIFNHVLLTEKILMKLSTTTTVSNDEETSTVLNTDTDIAASDCAQLQDNGHSSNGIYTIYVNGKRLDVYCDFQSYGGGWTVIQRRGYYPNDQENFNRNWEEYKTGFGYSAQEFWLGNENIHWMTNEKDVQLLIELKDFERNYAFAFYNTFKIDSELDLYRLHIGKYNGNASDSFAAHDQKPFSTYDKINDEVDPCCSCALTFEGGWWFYACFEAHLNGPYQNNPTNNGYFKGIIWEHWKGDYSLLMSEMKIRPLNYQNTQSTSSTDDEASVEDP